MHFARGRDAQRAIRYRQQAAEQALRHHAYPEAIDHLTTALEPIDTLPDSRERIHYELEAHITLGMALITTKGQAAPEVAQRFARARELCQEEGDARWLFQALFGLFQFYRARIAPQTAREIGEQLLALAQREPDPVLLVGAHYALGCALSYLGEVAQGRTHLEQGIACYDRQQHPAYVTWLGLDLGVVCLSALAWDLWLLGYPERSLTRSQEALILAHELLHPVSLAVTLYYATRLHQFRREGRAVRERRR